MELLIPLAIIFGIPIVVAGLFVGFFMLENRIAEKSPIRLFVKQNPLRAFLWICLPMSLLFALLLYFK
jgi:hypothetical protein